MALVLGVGLAFFLGLPLLLQRTVAKANGSSRGGDGNLRRPPKEIGARVLGA